MLVVTSQKHHQQCGTSSASPTTWHWHTSLARDAYKWRHSSCVLLLHRNIITNVYISVLFIKHVLQYVADTTSRTWMDTHNQHHLTILLKTRMTPMTVLTEYDDKNCIDTPTSLSWWPLHNAHSAIKHMCVVGFLQYWQNWRTHLRPLPLTSARHPRH